MTDRSSMVEGYGASEWATALGLNPYQTPRELAMLKRGLTAPKPPTPAMLRGNEFEPQIGARVAKMHEWALSPNSSRYWHSHHAHLWATPDFIHTDEDGDIDFVVEAKCHHPMVRKLYGDPGTDSVPEYILVQAHAQMACIRSINHVVVAPWFGLEDRDSIWIVHRNDEMSDRLAGEVEAHYLQYVLGPELPAAFGEDIPALRREAHNPDIKAHAPADIADIVEQLKAARWSAEVTAKRVSDLEAKVMDHMIRSGADTLGTPFGVITFKMGDGRKTIDTKRLRAEFPDAAKACEVQGEPSRTFRVPSEWKKEMKDE